MPSKHVADAVDLRLAENWTATPIIPYDTLAQPPEDANAFVVVHYPVFVGDRPVLERKFWEEGAIRIILNVRRGIGLSQGLAWADELAWMFRAVKFNGVETFVPDGPIVDDTIENGNWIEYAVVVPYRFEFDSQVFDEASI